jgi:hypothetical protein
MTLNFPDYEILIDDIINLSSGNTTDSISALSNIRLIGNVVDASGNKVQNFNGTATVKMFDKPGTATTLGSKIDSPPMDYQVFNNILFNGQASVESGEFEIETIIPRNIDFSFGQARVNMYSVSESADAFGASTDLTLGGSENVIITDNRSPRMRLYLDDTTFINGGQTGASPLFIARLNDESGINLSNSGIGTAMTLTIDDKESYQLSEFFISDIDDFTNGWVFFNIEDLTKGRHTLKFEVSDNFNNRTIGELEFVVGENPGIRITGLFNSPNPFIIGTNTRFIIEHNRFDEDVSISIQIHNLNGEIVSEINQEFFGTQFIIDEMEWDGKSFNGQSPLNGLYIYRVNIRSLTDGSGYNKAGKMILIN